MTPPGPPPPFPASLARGWRAFDWGVIPPSPSPADGACPPAVADVTARAAFAAAAPASALAVKWGAWSWTPEHPFPAWEALLRAPLYHDPVHAELLKLLSARVYRAVAAPGGATGHVRTSRVALLDGGRRR